MKSRVGTIILATIMTTGIGVAGAFAEFPERPVIMVVPFGAGGGTDTMARVLGPAMGKALGQQVVVVNKTGAAGTVGAADLARAKTDGYTIGLLPIGPLTTQPHLRKLPYGIDSFDYVCEAYAVPITLAVAKDSPFQTAKDLVDYAKANPGKLNYGSGGAGTIPEVATSYLFKVAGVDIVHIPFKDAAGAVTALLGRHSDMFTDTTAVIARNDLKGIGLFAEERASYTPGIPTLKEQGYDVGSWQVWGGIEVPKGVPAAIVKRLESACQDAVYSDAWKQLMEKLNFPAEFGNGAAFEKLVRSDFERFGKLLKK